MNSDKTFGLHGYAPDNHAHMIQGQKLARHKLVARRLLLHISLFRGSQARVRLVRANISEASSSNLANSQSR